MKKLLSIIVPFHNVENYISDCLQSILNQGLKADNYEVILVNDGSEDRSMERISNLLAENSNFHIYEQSSQGPSIARNTALSHAQGDYILMMDADDILVDNSLPIFLQHAMTSRCDMAVANFIKLASDSIPRYRSKTHKPVSIEQISGCDYFVRYLNPRECFVWRTLYRKEFLDQNNLRFIPGIYFEDIPFTIECYLHAEKCLKVDMPLYIYRQHEGSIVSTVNMKKLKDLNKVIAKLQEIKESEQWPTEVKQVIDDNIFATFSITIWYLTHDKNLLVKRHEYVEDLKKNAPSINFTHGIKQRVVSYLYRLMPNTYIKLRSL